MTIIEMTGAMIDEGKEGEGEDTHIVDTNKQIVVHNVTCAAILP